MSGWGGGYPLMQGKDSAKSGNLRNVSRVLVFKVGGTATLPALAPEQQLVLNPPPATADAATVAAGHRPVRAVLRRLPRRERSRRRRGS